MSSLVKAALVLGKNVVKKPGKSSPISVISGTSGYSISLPETDSSFCSAAFSRFCALCSSNSSNVFIFSFLLYIKNFIYNVYATRK